MCYLTGNYISIILDPARQEKAQLLFDRGWQTFLRPESLRQLLVTDWISGGYAALAVFVILLAYAGSRWAEPGAYLIGGPGWIMLGVAYVTGVLLLVLLVFLVGVWLLGILFVGQAPSGADLSELGGIGLQFALTAATVAFYAYSSRWAVGATTMVREAGASVLTRQHVRKTNGQWVPAGVSSHRRRASR